MFRRPSLQLKRLSLPYWWILVPRGCAPFGEHQESRFLVLTKRSAASGDENDIGVAKLHLTSRKFKVVSIRTSETIAVSSHLRFFNRHGVFKKKLSMIYFLRNERNQLKITTKFIKLTTKLIKLKLYTWGIFIDL